MTASTRGSRLAKVAALCLLVCFAVGPATGAQPLEPDTPVEERAQARSYTVRLRIEPKYFAEPGECLGLGLDELNVTLRGKSIDGEHGLRFLREPQPTLHILVVGIRGSYEDDAVLAREAVRQYIEQLDTERDRAMIVTYGPSVVMLQPATSDREALLNAVMELRPSGGVEMVEAMYYAIQEATAHRERPVILTLTESPDPGRYYDRDDLWQMVERRPDLMMFTIGLDLPDISRGLPPGYTSGRRFLQNLAKETNGRFFHASLPTQMEPIYLRIREMLDNEATLFVIDPDPESEPGKVKVSSRREGCKVKIYREQDEEVDLPSSMQPIPRPFRDPRALILVEPHHRLQRYYEDNPKQWIDPACRRLWQTEGQIEESWFLEVDWNHVFGCTLDSTLDAGWLFDRRSLSGLGCNNWGRIKTRPFHVRIPPLSDLPSAPEAYADRLAAHALRLAREEIQLDTQRCFANECRPHHDHPLLQNGRIFFEIRPKLAHAVFMNPEYRAWVLARLSEQAELDLAALKERYRRMYPDRSEAELATAVENSPEAEGIRRRASTPSEIDLQGHLAAWQGDISAQDLFTRWEVMRLNRELAGGPPGTVSFPPAWRALRLYLGLPAYVRVLTLMALVRDPATDTIGYWRIVFPRPEWFGTRMTGFDTEDYGDLPMDLIPKLPLGYWVVKQIVDSDPALALLLDGDGYRVRSVSYDLLGKSKTHRPQVAFKHTLVTVSLHGEDPDAELSFAATIDMPANSRDNPTLRAIDVYEGTDSTLADRIAAAASKVLAR